MYPNKRRSVGSLYSWKPFPVFLKKYLGHPLLDGDRRWRAPGTFSGYRLKDSRFFHLLYSGGKRQCSLINWNQLSHRPSVIRQHNLSSLCHHPQELAQASLGFPDSDVQICHAIFLQP